MFIAFDIIAFHKCLIAAIGTVHKCIALERISYALTILALKLPLKTATFLPCIRIGCKYIINININIL